MAKVQVGGQNPSHLSRYDGKLSWLCECVQLVHVNDFAEWQYISGFCLWTAISASCATNPHLSQVKLTGIGCAYSGNGAGIGGIASSNGVMLGGVGLV